jgi:peptide/nickel transport system substrate-binding protein
MFWSAFWAIRANLARFVVPRQGRSTQQTKPCLVLLPLLLLWLGPRLAPAQQAPSPARPQAQHPDAGPDTLRVVIEADPAHLNPLLDPDLWGYRIAHDLICEPLIRSKPGPQGSGAAAAAYEGVLAERFSFDPDGMGATFYIRRGVRFHDGKALTAHDVRFTLDRLFASGSVAPRTRALLADLLRVSVLGPHALRVELRRPSGRLLQDLSEIDILPEHLFNQGSLAYQPQNRRPVCTGPYRLAEWRHGDGGEIVLCRDPGYWGTPGRSEVIRFLIVKDATRGLALVRRGGADVLGSVPALYVPDQVEPAMLRGRLRTLEVPARQLSLVLWNGRHPALSLPAVRRALSGLIDRQRLVREVRHGLAEPRALPPPLPPGDPAPWELAAAEATLDEAGVTRQSAGGPRSFGGRPLRLTLLVPAGSSEAGAAAKRIAEMLSRTGILVQPEVQDMSTLQARLRRGAFDAALLAWSWTGAMDEPDLRPLLARTGAQAHGRGESADLDGALDAAARATAERHKGATEHLAALLRREEPVSFLYRPRQLLLVGLQVADVSISGDFLNLRAAHRVNDP